MPGALRDLDADALTLLDALLDGAHRDGADLLDDATLHRLVGAIGRRLRTTRPSTALHGGLVLLPSGSGVLVTGQSGAGKSTLVALLGARRGAAFVSDDTVWLDGNVGRGFGAPMAVRRESPIVPVALGDRSASSSDRIVLHPSELGIRGPLPGVDISLVVFPQVVQRGREPDAVDGIQVVPTATILDPAETYCRLMGVVFGTPTVEQALDLARVATSVAGTSITYGDLEGSLEAFDAALARTTHVRAEPQVELLAPEELAGSDLAPTVVGIRFGSDDVALWQPAARRCVRIGGWTRHGSVRGTPAHDGLLQLGFLRHDVRIGT